MHKKSIKLGRPIVRSLFCLGFSICAATQSVAQPTDQAAIQQVRKILRDNMRDSSSAQFRNESVKTQGSDVWVCGEVNGKNGYGGYTGYISFVIPVTFGDQQEFVRAALDGYSFPCPSSEPFDVISLTVDAEMAKRGIQPRSKQ